MQRITRKTADAFLDCEEIKIDNSEVRVDQNGVARYFLFGNCIARHFPDGGRIEINSRGYRTHTTKNRFRGLARRLRRQDVYAPMVFQQSHSWYLDDTDTEFPHREWIAFAEYDGSL